VVATKLPGWTTKLTPLLATPFTVTTTFPVVAPDGTVTTICVSFHVVTGTLALLSVTVLVPCVAPKLVPIIVTDVPTAPEVGERLMMVGAATSESTLKLTLLLATPDTVTTTGPVVAPFGTVTVMLVVLQLVTEAIVPLNVIVLEPWMAPKPLPEIVRDDPTGPELGDKPAITGAGATTTTVVEPQIWPVHALTVTAPVATPKTMP
jgi:hypothetical protein